MQKVCGRWGTCAFCLLFVCLLSASPLLGQEKRLWLLRAPGEMVEYDLTNFATKQTVKVLAEAVKSPAGISDEPCRADSLCTTGVAAALG